MRQRPGGSSDRPRIAVNQASKRPWLGTPGLTRSGDVEWDSRYSFVTLLLQTCANIKCALRAGTPPFESQAILDVNVKRSVLITYTESRTESPKRDPTSGNCAQKGKLSFH